MAAKPFWFCPDCREDAADHAGGGGDESDVEVIRAMHLHNAMVHGIPLPQPLVRTQKYRHYTSDKIAGFYDAGCA